jgi:alpha-glucosidase
VRRADGSVVLADAPEHAWSVTPAGELRWEVALADGERVFGGGQRTGPLDKRGRVLTFWSTDPLPNHNDATDGMYQSVPLLICLRDGKAAGIFYDTNWRAAVDIGKSDPTRLSYTTTGPDVVAYIFMGPTLADVLQQYTSITGRMPSPPRWSLGNQQSRWSYRTADELRAIAASFREHQIPCDALYLDIDYMRGYRDFTWDPERFPDPAGLVRELRAQGFRVVPIIDPGVKIDADYATYREGMERGYFVRDAAGSVFAGWVWPGHSVWTDFARADAAAWWGEQLRVLLASGIAGIWNDMNEPSQAAMFAPQEVTVPFGATLPLDAQHSTPADPLSHAAFHNAYGDAMNRATRAEIERARPDERAFVLTRAAGAGGQRAAIVWNGDNTSQWEHVKLAVTMNLGVGLSGYPVTGFDIGGFWSDTEPELLVRFTQIGAFMPFCRNHSAVGTRQQEPWAFGEPYTSACREAIARRYELLPLLTTLFHEASTTGAPIVRPLAWLAPADDACAGCDDEFLLGDDLLVAPVLVAGATSRDVLLPPGQWFDWTTGVIHQGGQRVTVPVTLATTPIFTRAGMILPKAGVVQHTDEPITAPLTLHAHLTREAPNATLTLWDDDDHPQAEARGTFAAYHVTAAWSGDEIVMRVEQHGGQMSPRYPGVRVAVHLPPDVTATLVGPTEGSLAELPITFRFHVNTRE